MIRWYLPLIMLVSPAAAHSWYPATCCGDRDCAAISDDMVTPVPGGYDVHAIVDGTAVNGFVPNSQAKPAREGGEYHLCLKPDRSIRCFFYPAPAY